MLSTILLAVLLCPNTGFQPTSNPSPARLDGWTVLPIPALCRPSPRSLVSGTQLSGTHILVGDAQRRAPDFQTAPFLPLLNLIELLEADARRQGTDLRCLRTAPPLLARGSSAGLERARSLLGELERAAATHRIQLELALFPIAEPDAQVASSSGIEVRSGESVRIGKQQSSGFLADFDVDAASGGGTADPLFGQIVVGQTATLTAWRTPRGDAVFVAGEINLAELLGVSAFEPGAPELGSIESPRIGSVTVRFSGLVDESGELVIEVRGAPLSRPDWDLSIRATTTPDEPGEWRVVDLAWMESSIADSPVTSPGAGLSLPAIPSLDRVENEPLSAAILWGELEASLAGRRVDRPLFSLAPGVFVAPATEERIWTELDLLLDAASQARSRTYAVTVRTESLEVTLSAAEGLAFSVQAGIETTALVDYDVELAPDFWIADPIVERIFDGLWVSARVAEGDLAGDYWIAESLEHRILDRDVTLHGKVLLPKRELSLGTLRVRAGERVQSESGLSVAVGSL